MLETLTGIAAATTKITDFLRNLFDPAGRTPKWVWNVVPAAIGQAVAHLSNLNIMSGLDVAQDMTLSTQQTITGLTIFAAASGWHEVLDLISGAAKRRHAEARAEDAIKPVRPGEMVDYGAGLEE